MGHGFATRRDAERVAAATEYVERMRKDELPVRPRWFRQRIGTTVYAVKLTADIASSEAAGVLCEWDAATEAFSDTATAITVYDSLGIFAGATSGKYGYAVKRLGDGRDLYDLIQLEC